MNNTYQPISDKEAELTIALVKQFLTPDLLKGKYVNRPLNAHNTWGLCSVASEAIYFILGGPKRGLVSYVARDTDGSTHWWLKDSTGKIIDPTIEQYTSIGLLPPYQRGISGKPCGFMGIRIDINNKFGFDRKPSNRASILLNNIFSEPTNITESKNIKNKI